jgi:methyl halide transferase
MLYNQAEFWQPFYQQNDTPWDLGKVAPPFVSLLKQRQADLPPGKMAVLGCGYGHDAAFFGQQGFDVMGFDYVPEAIAGAQERYGQWATFQQKDIFYIEPELNEQFDYVLEHTCFCAIVPALRQEYVSVAHRLLKPKGRFIGLIWADVPHESGPPFASTTDEIKTLFEPQFRVDEISTPNDSINWRNQQERLCLFTKNA